jgi:hypothetical protein
MTDTEAATDFQKPRDAAACPPAGQILKFEREDWSLYRTVEGLQQKAGVAKVDIPKLIMKELVDNSGDEAATKVDIGRLPNGGYFIEDDGRGIDGEPQDIARLFSIARPMVSTKLLRLPTRGALGNGLRVVAGAVLASEGSLVVITRNRRIVFRPERDGTTTVVSAHPLAEGKTFLVMCVNRTPITGRVRAVRDNREINFFGCGLYHEIATAPKDEQFGIVLNLTTAYMPITSDGKAPDHHHGREVPPTLGQVFFYFGPNVHRLESVFRRIGFGTIPAWSFDEAAE